uniref:Immunoglobulin V-set domain-containing protein n=1 Tax=Cyprinus carpio TaxID=7962 RepID=A0A8C2DVL0_CYPCA
MLQFTAWHEKFNLLLLFSAKIRCNYNPTNDTESMTAVLQTLNLSLCSYYLHDNEWKTHYCKDPVRFTWIPETKDITFELLNLQIQDTGTYTCTVKRIVKPPQVDLGVQRVQVTVFVMLTVALTVFLITLVICKHYSKSQCLY